MKKTRKVSIDGISFTVEDEAYDILKGYLDTLESHYQGNPNGGEIVEGIEARIAELFLDKAGSDGVVSGTMAEGVIALIGKPEEIFSDGEKPEAAYVPARRKLYRNPDDKRIAGVLGGIAAYFGIDAVWLRLGYALISFGSCFSDSEIFNVLLFFGIYCILWICMPLAKSNRQRCEMSGKPLSYNGIEREVERESRQSGIGRDTGKRHDFVTIAGKIVIVCTGILLGFCGMIGILAIFGVLFGIAVAGFAIPDLFSSVLTAVGETPYRMAIIAKILVAILIALPCIALLYIGIRLIFNIRAPKWKPGLVMLCIWVLSLIGLCGFGIGVSRNFWNTENAVAYESIDSGVDTLYVKFVDVEKWQGNPVLSEGDLDEYNLVWFDLSDRKAMKVIAYPSIELERSNYAEPGIKVTSEYFRRAMTDTEAEAARRPGFCRLEGDTLFVSPVIYGGANGIKHAEVSIEVTMPNSKALIVTGPFSHDFNSEFHRSDLPDGLFGR